MAVISFLERVQDETPTVGGFSLGSELNTFDENFKEACDTMTAAGLNPMLDINQIIRKPEVAKKFTDLISAGIVNECACRDPQEWGTYANMDRQVSDLLDNVTAQLMKETTTVGQLMPIKAIDYPLVVKQHLSLATKDVMQTEVTKSPVVKKQIERNWLVDKQNGTRWEYPQCFFKPEEAREIFAAGKGLPILNGIVENADGSKTDYRVPVPSHNFDVVGRLTKAQVPKREKITFGTRIVRGYIMDETDPSLVKAIVPLNIYIDLHLNMWAGGNINTKVEDLITTGATVDVVDTITGTIDFVTNTVTISSSTGKIKYVDLEGYLSNDKNERAISMDVTREEREWKITDGHRINVPHSVEELEDAKALLDLDLYKRTYNYMSKIMTDMEDQQIIDYLDEEFIRYSGIELDPLGWNSFIRETNFNCDGTALTTALPSEYIAKELKFKIDRFVIDITETAKMEDIVFVLYGNPKYISLLGDGVRWVISNGQSTGGIKHNYSYGIMNSGNVKVQVVSSLKFSSFGDMHRGLRLIPYPLNKEQITFKHYKYSTHVLTAQNSAYRDPDLPGGSMTNIMGVSRYESTSLQGIQGYITFTHDDFVNSTLTTKRTAMPVYQYLPTAP